MLNKGISKIEISPDILIIKDVGPSKKNKIML